MKSPSRRLRRSTTQSAIIRASYPVSGAADLGDVKGSLDNFCEIGREGDSAPNGSTSIPQKEALTSYVIRSKGSSNEQTSKTPLHEYLVKGRENNVKKLY